MVSLPPSRCVEGYPVADLRAIFADQEDALRSIAALPTVVCAARRFYKVGLPNYGCRVAHGDVVVYESLHGLLLRIRRKKHR